MQVTVDKMVTIYKLL